MEFHAYYNQMNGIADRRNLRWNRARLADALLAAKEKGARDMDKSIAMAEQLEKVLSSPAPKATPVVSRSFVPSETKACMLPVEPAVSSILLTTGNKEATERYLRARNKKSPEEKFYFRECTSWDYGWKQSESQMRRDCNYGRQKIVKMSFYRENNIAPDRDHYRQPATANNNVCDRELC